MNCIVIAKLMGTLVGDIQHINESNVSFYNLECDSGIHSVIVRNDEFIEVNVLKINRDLSYAIKIKG